MSYYLILTFLLVLVKVPPAKLTSDNPLLTYESLYNDAVNFYLDNNWGQCTLHFEFALEDYHWWRKNIIRCRKECYQEAEDSEHIFPDSFRYDNFFERMVINTLCLVKCKGSVFDKRAELMAPPDIDRAFEIRKPYDYLQLCYFKMGQLEDAANAAATVLAAQPEHEVMQANLKYYVEIGELNIEDIVNLELQEFAKEYMKADNAYTNEEFEGTITHMEKSLSLFYEELEGCRLLCENPFDMGWHPDFISSIANHYTFTLRCKRKCIDDLSNLYGEKIENFVASYFNYLQFSYSKVGDLNKACEAVETFLTLVPEDSIQLRNKQYLWSMQGIQEEFFTPRKEIVALKSRFEKEDKLMKFIELNFVALNEDKESMNKDSTPIDPAESIPSIAETLVDIINLLGTEAAPASTRDEL